MKYRPPTESHLFDPDLFEKGDNGAIEHVYKKYAEQFVGWAFKNFALTKETAEDVFGKAVMVFRKKAWNRELGTYKGIGINTLLFALAKNIIRDDYKKSALHTERYLPLEEGHHDIADQSFPDLADDNEIGRLFETAESDREREVRKAFYALGEKCQQILLMRIVYGCSIEEIAEKLKFKNTDSAKTQKNKCFNKLKSFLGLR